VGAGHCLSLSWLGLLVGAGVLFMAVGVLAGHRRFCSGLCYANIAPNKHNTAVTYCSLCPLSSCDSPQFMSAEQL
jgi:hypothetical protein